MCSRTYLKTSAATLASLFDAAWPPPRSPDMVDEGPLFNIAPTDPVPIVRMQKDANARELAFVRWGLVPSWSKDKKGAARCINARAETVEEKPSFRSAFKKRRCLFVVDGFYEWRTEGKKKWPFVFKRLDDRPLAFAGLWEVWRDKADDSALHTASVVTCAPNAFMGAFHNRMPVLLDGDAQDAWLDADAPTPLLKDLLKPAPENALTAYAVDPKVNNVRAEGPDLLEPLADED